eukprot:g19326.t1
MGAFGALDSLQEGATKRKARQTYSSLGGTEFRAERREEDVESETYQLLNPAYREGPRNEKNWEKQKNRERDGKLFAPEPRAPIPAAEAVGRLRVKDETPWRQYQDGHTISRSDISMRGYTTKKRFTPVDIKGTEFDNIAPPPTRDGPVGSLSARDLIDPAAIPASVPNTKQAEEHVMKFVVGVEIARDCNSKPDTEADSDSFEEKNHLTCTEDACLNWFRGLAVGPGGNITQKLFDEFAAYAENPLAGMVNKNVFSCEDEKELADVMDAERRALQSRIINMGKTGEVFFCGSDVPMAVEFLTKSKTRRALEYIKRNSETSSAARA